MIKKITLIMLLFVAIDVCGQEKYTISGYITDISSGESIVGANIYSNNLQTGVISNTYGFYSLTLPKGEHEITFTFIGYTPQTKNINLVANTTYNVAFDIANVNINEVKVLGKANIVEQTQTSVIEVPINQIKTIPALLGEVDVLKAIQLLPGVQSSEGTSGFYVRGGGPDQNLILLDGVPVYNASHIGGLFSVFNADAIKTVRLTKGGFPARFGGRLSSVLQIDMREGNSKKYNVDATLGLISSKLTIEGPIIKEKTSFLLSGRRTYADLLVKPFMPSNTKLKLYFYDLNAKINHKISKKDRIYLSAYMGNDVFGVDYSGAEGGEKGSSSDESIDFGIGYGNITATLRWNHLFSEKLFSNTTLTYSRYAFRRNIAVAGSQSSVFGNEAFNVDYGYLSGIEDWGGRIDFDFMPNPNHDIKFGTSYTYHHFFPGETDLLIDYDYPTLDTINTDIYLDTMLNFSAPTNVHEMFVYIEDNVKLSSRLKANIGVHLGFYSLANTDDITTKNGIATFNPKLFEKITDISSYTFQPRISARYLLNDNWSLKASYAEMQQNIHLLSNSSIGFPSDIWVPAVDNVKPQKSKQWALSVATELFQNTYELSLEGYYKTMEDLIAYKAGYSTLQSTESWENAVETGGEGESYGAEFFLQKKKGNTTGWFGYTLSWTNRRFDNINFGNWFPYKYDRRHDFSFVISHKFNEKWDVGATWVYGTGNAITFPQGVYFGMPNNEEDWGEKLNIDLVESYGSRNSTRLPAYHRLDIGINKHAKKKNWSSTWSFGAYNLYNRKNPFFAYLNYQNNQRVATQVSLFPIIPSVSYRIKF